MIVRVILKLMNYSDGVRLYLFNTNVHKKHSSFQYFFVSEKVEHKLLMAKGCYFENNIFTVLDRSGLKISFVSKL